MLEETVFVEKYRPKIISDCVLPKSIKKELSDFIKTGNIPNLIFHGSNGCGKTTAALACASELNYNSIIINCGLDLNKDALRGRVSEFASSLSFDGNKKLVILDESDRLDATHVQTSLPTFIEEFSKNCSFIFTCNHPRKLIEAIHSRCASISFKSFFAHEEELQIEFVKRLIGILKSEKINFNKTHVPVLLSLVKKFYPDFRRVLNEIQRYTAGGSLDEGILVTIAELDIDELIKSMIKRNWNEVRTWVALNTASEIEIYRLIYDNMEKYMENDSIPQTVATLNDHQYKSAFVADAEINIMDCMSNLMSDVVWKE